MTDQTLCFACLLPVAFLLAEGLGFEEGSGRGTPAGGGHVDAQGAGERPAWVFVFLCTVPAVEGQGVGHGLPGPGPRLPSPPPLSLFASLISLEPKSHTHSPSAPAAPWVSDPAAPPGMGCLLVCHLDQNGSPRISPQFFLSPLGSRMVPEIPRPRPQEAPGPSPPSHPPVSSHQAPSIFFVCRAPSPFPSPHRHPTTSSCLADAEPPHGPLPPLCPSNPSSSGVPLS